MVRDAAEARPAWRARAVGACTAFAVVAALGVAACDVGPDDAGAVTTAHASTAGLPPVPAPRAHPAPASPVADPVEDSVYARAARAAWAYLTENRSPRTGLVRATQGWDNLTTWDLASLIAGVHSAGELGLAEEAEIEAWLNQVLETLIGAPMYDDAAYNKTYVAATGQMVDRAGKASPIGVGWSALDLGRLLIWLKIVEQEHPTLAHAARSAAQRIDFQRIVGQGVLTGEDLDSRGNPRTYPEGRVGYEQYAAQGYALWGHPPARSLDYHLNADTVTVLGHTLYVDKRGRNKITSEPFILKGMEVGWDAEARSLAETVLAVQQARFEQTGTVTMVSEDAIERPPYYFYYYTIYADGQPFRVQAHGPIEGDGPRWISSKAAYAWHALLPSDYTWRAVQEVEPAFSERGWSSGVFESNRKSTGVRNLNTAGIILEAAAYRERGRPFLAGEEQRAP